MDPAPVAWPFEKVLKRITSLQSGRDDLKRLKALK
jgi:hypothetical protein